MSYKIPVHSSRIAIAIAFLAILGEPFIGRASTILGTSQAFAVLGASTVTDTGATTINGNLGLSPGSAITGLASITLTGSVHQTDGVASLAEANAMSGFDTLSALLPTSNLSGQVLGSGVSVLDPGVYYFSSSAEINGTLTLDALNQSNALFVFQIGSTLTSDSGSMVDIINGGTNTQVYWEVGSSATLQTTAEFAGNILADQSITLDTGANILCGRAIALNGAVTMDTNTISDTCADGGNYSSGRSDFGSLGFSGVTVQATPEPGSAMLAGCGLLVFLLWKLSQRLA